MNLMGNFIYFQSIQILHSESTDKEEYGLECKKVLLDAHKHLSQFTDTLYKQISKYIKTDLQKRIHEVQNDKKKVEALMDVAKLTYNKDKMKAGSLLMKQCNLEQNDINNMNKEKLIYLKIALQ